MKDLNLNKEVQIVEETISSDLSFNEVLVYNEMADQTSVRLNLIEQIHAQLRQMDELVGRKQFLLKEISNEILR